VLSEERHRRRKRGGERMESGHEENSHSGGRWGNLRLGNDVGDAVGSNDGLHKVGVTVPCFGMCRSRCGVNEVHSAAAPQHILDESCRFVRRRMGEPCCGCECRAGRRCIGGQGRRQHRRPGQARHTCKPSHSTPCRKQIVYAVSQPFQAGELESGGHLGVGVVVGPGVGEDVHAAVLQVSWSVVSGHTKPLPSC
jgi:hypothetical protein